MLNTKPNKIDDDGLSKYQRELMIAGLIKRYGKLENETYHYLY